MLVYLKNRRVLACLVVVSMVSILYFLAQTNNIDKGSTIKNEAKKPKQNMVQVSMPIRQRQVQQQKLQYQQHQEQQQLGLTLIQELEQEQTQKLEQQRQKERLKKQKQKIQQKQKQIQHQKLQYQQLRRKLEQVQQKHKQQRQKRKRKREKERQQKKLQQQQEIEQARLPSSDCAIWDKPKHWRTSTPRIVLDSNRLLYPGLKGGPNKQIIGLWQSIYVAIRLNRTLVIPKFYSHFTNGNHAISAFQMIDVKRLCHFVSCTNIKTMNRMCGKSFDVVLQGMIVKEKYIKKYENSSGMAILHHLNETYAADTKRAVKLRLKGKKSSSKIPALPNDEFEIDARSPWLKTDQSTLTQAYGTNSRCAIFTAPFTTLRFDKMSVSPLEQFSKDFKNVSDELMLATIIDVVRRPPYIVELAKRYIQNAFNSQRFVGVHWRFDRDKEWGKNCKRTRPRNFDISYFRACVVARNATATDVAQLIEKVMLAELKHEEDITKPITIYIATPPSNRKFQERVYAKLNKLTVKLEKPKKDLKSFLSDKFEKCKTRHAWKNLPEVLSLTEMEIMRMSKWFFYSEFSTWSENVRLLRWNLSKEKYLLKKFEIPILKQLQDRLAQKKNGLPFFRRSSKLPQ